MHKKYAIDIVVDFKHPLQLGFPCKLELAYRGDFVAPRLHSVDSVRK